MTKYILPKENAKERVTDMTRRMNNKSKLVKAVSVALSIYMALSPMVVYADELADAENNLSVQNEVRNEAAKSVGEAVDNAVISMAQADFEKMVADVDVSDMESRNILGDTSALVQDEIDRIGNEAIKEVADAIVNVDMSNADDALDTVTELLDNTLTDETVASEIEVVADALISVYDAQADAALNALKVISEESEAVTVLEDGSVSVDWDKATDEVKALESAYLKAVSDKENAELAKKEANKKKNEVAEKRQAASDKVDELNNGIINDNKEINEKISESKLNKNDDINSIIDTIVANNDKPFADGDYIDKKIEGSSDIYRFYVNTVRDGVAYGCLTYYDSESKTILRKNFSISATGEIDYNYVPKAEWVKKDPNCKEVIFGNSSNYVVAYVGDKELSKYISNGKFNGTNVSDIMRENVELNSAIDARNEAVNARNEAINELQEIEVNIAEVEKELEIATNAADDALNKYKGAVAMYKDVASLENEIKKNEVEIAMLEYVKAEVEVFRKQQVLDRVKKEIEESNVPGTFNDNRVGEEENIEIFENNLVEEEENIEAVVNSIASNLGVAPEVVESMVVQTIIETENSFYGVANGKKKAAVAGVRRDEKDLEGINVKPVTEDEVAENVVENQNDIQDLVTIEDNMVPLAATILAVDNSVNWLPLIIASICVAWMMFVVAKKNQKEEKANI